ncbi:MAG: VOC family protein [Verrucomicrobiota bacterium]
MNPLAKLSSATTMLIVADVKKTAEFYRDTLGFEIEFVIEEGVPFSAVFRDGYKIFFESYPNYKEDYRNFEKAAVKCGVYFMVEDVDALYEELKGRGAAFAWTPQNQAYGNRDMKLLDNNGYQLLFATELENE